MPELNYDKNAWATPSYIVKAIKKEMDIILDAAASDENHKCDLFITKEMDGLKLNWRNYTGKKKSNNEAVWINPPYGKGLITQWIDKAIIESVCNHYTVVMLVPASPDAKWFGKAARSASEIRFITDGRLAFEHPETGAPISGNTGGSAIIIFRPLAKKGEVVTRYITRADLKALAEDTLVGECHG